jgi:LacI family transcriptional regulator
MKAAQELGINIPEDLSVIGFDDIFGAELTTPALSTIKSPLEQAGQQAVNLLMALLDGEPLEPQPELVTRLVLRQSSAKPSKGK